ncbi:heat stress transcription factor A-5-like [Zingiber officinale]|uniref:HSF-type DNA-binding domain-containing protein n=1 Tax=Zingiber officinale TaxID=94328 RepID=A0A8J5KTE8_ZINOF|nr:heat stress transcription factor A-5-like [Zingiber officinale]KAG6492110.1 hypothetical protein ZIOFF_047060 [Zingiber officinale]
MDGGVSGGGGGPAPFLLKTYEMVDDASTNDIVSWSATNASFVVWNHTEFAARLLPTYFKHNNFSSFIRQLNTYGFRKIDPERWEFSNDDFVKGKKHLLKSIHRRKPIHSHSHPPGGAFSDAERTALEEEIERLNREKASLEASLFKFQLQQSGTLIQLEDLERRVVDMEQRQRKMVAFLQRAMKNPQLMESLVKMASTAAIDVSVINKKRRLPLDRDYCQDCSENSFCDDHSSITKSDTGFILDQDFCDKLKIGLCSAIQAGDNVVVVSNQHFDVAPGNPQVMQIDCDQEMLDYPPQVSETLQLCDTEAHVCASKKDLFARSFDEDGLLPCRLSLTLSSTTLEIDGGKCSTTPPQLVDQGSDSNDTRIPDADGLTSSTQRDNDLTVASIQSMADDSADAEVVSFKAAGPTTNDASSATSGGANDIFWQQFLTERPGSVDADSLGSDSINFQNNEQMPGNDDVGAGKKEMEQLKL